MFGNNDTTEQHTVVLYCSQYSITFTHGLVIVLQNFKYIKVTKFGYQPKIKII